MADQDGVEACKLAYQASIAQIYVALISNLAAATTDAQKQAAIEQFKKGVQLCKEARQICEQAVG